MFIIPCEEDSDFYKSEMNSHFDVCFHDIFHNFVNQLTLKNYVMISCLKL